MAQAPHRCHAIDCNVIVARRMLMCSPHWNLVPLDLQRRVWAAYRHGQEKDGKVTADYVAAATAAVRAVLRLERGLGAEG